MTVLEVPGFLQINIENNSIWLSSPSHSITLSLDQMHSFYSALPVSQWIHLSLGGSALRNITFLRVDLQDQVLGSSSSQYIPIRFSSSYAFLGRGISNLSMGLVGDLREFLFTAQYIEASQVSNVRNQVIYWNMSHYAN